MVGTMKLKTQGNSPVRTVTDVVRNPIKTIRATIKLTIWPSYLQPETASTL